VYSFDCSRRVLDLDPSLGGAHYGLAFLLLKRGDETAAAEHLAAFLERSPHGPESERWVRHARQTLAELRGEPTDEPAADQPAPDAGRAGSATRADAGRADASRGDGSRGDTSRGDTGRGPETSAGGAGARF